MTLAKRGLTPTKSRSGWVYVVTNPAWDGFVKLGSTSDLNKRLSSYNTGSPHRDYSLVVAARFPDRMLAERSLHHQLQGVRLGSTEWFQVHPEDARHHIKRLLRQEEGFHE